MKVYLYVVAASANPDAVECPVPWRVDDELVFFGPCKKRLREALRDSYLSPTHSTAEIDDPIYLIGVNGSNSKRVRKVLWAGRLRRIMTFAAAYHATEGDARFRKLRDHSHSPRHLRPMYSENRLVGYEHISREHDRGDAWVMDLIKSRDSPLVAQDGKRLLLRPWVNAWDGFPRDATLFLDNIFFARGRGLSIDPALVSILRRAQPGVEPIDAYAIFGYRKDGTAEGRTGSYLLIDRDDVAHDLIQWIRSAPTPVQRLSP
jgi:hypothetical protein